MKYTLVCAYILAKNKISNSHTDSRYAFRVAYDFGMLWKQQVFLTSRGNTIKNGPNVQDLLDAMLLTTALATINKIQGHSKLDSTRTRGNHLANISARNATFKGINSSQTSVMVQRAISPNNNLETLAKEAQRLASEKENQDWEFSNYWYDRESSGLDQITTQSYQRLNFPLLTTCTCIR